MCNTGSSATAHSHVGGVTFVADAGNHRVLGWTPRPDGDDDADLVLGQSDFESANEWPYGPQSATAFRFPYAIDVSVPRSGTGDGGDGAGMLAMADTANNRILVWDSIPATSGRPADLVPGQPDFTANGENRWQAVEADTLCWPYGIRLHDSAVTGTRLAVADSGNNRVMIWHIARRGRGDVGGANDSANESGPGSVEQ